MKKINITNIFKFKTSTFDKTTRTCRHNLGNSKIWLVIFSSPLKNIPNVFSHYEHFRLMKNITIKLNQYYKPHDNTNECKLHLFAWKSHRQTRVPPWARSRMSGARSWPSSRTSCTAAWPGVHGSPLQRLWLWHVVPAPAQKLSKKQEHVKLQCLTILKIFTFWSVLNWSMIQV